MKLKVRLSVLVAVVVIAASTNTNPLAALTYEVIEYLERDHGQANPLGGLVRGSDGALYGTTSGGVPGICGAVYRLAADDSISWLHTFVSGEGCHPAGDLAVGPDGALYGVTYWTDASFLAPNNFGTVYRLALDGTHTVLHYFTAGTEGSHPYAGLTLAPNGLFYGSTTTGTGVLFTISPAGGDYTILARGLVSQASLTLGSDGDLWGTTTGSTTDCGTVFRMTLGGTINVVHAFLRITDPNPVPNRCPEGSQLLGELVEGPDGSFFGTASLGGPATSDQGHVFKVTPSGDMIILHQFTQAAAGTDGSSPWAGLTLGSDGKLYGVGTTGGAGLNGTAFRLAQDGSDYEVLRSFDGFDGSGSQETRPLEVSPGVFIGTAQVVIYRLTVEINQPPVAQSASLSVDEDIATPGTLMATDSTNDPLTYSIVTNGSLGTAIVTNTATGAFTYTPNPNVSGSDSFTFQVADGTFQSNVATIAVTISAVNDAPVSQDGSNQTNAGVPVNGTLVATDIDSATLTYSVVANGTLGTAAITNAATGAYTYTPAAGQSGTDVFMFKANDGTVDSNVSAVTVTIRPNHPPVALDGTLNADEDRVSRGRVMATDADANPLTFALVTNASKGTVVLTSSTGRFTYTPNPNANGADSFTFRAFDGIDNSNVGTISITIAAINDAPVAADSSAATSPGTPVTAAFQASDPDGDALTFAVTRMPRGGTLVINGNGTFTYTPNAGFTGIDSFRYRASDSQASSAQATVSIVVK